MADSPSPTTNAAAQSFDNILSSIALQKMVPAVELLANTSIEAAVPFLASPVVKQVTEFVEDEAIKEIATLLLQQMVALGVKIIITVQTDEEKATYSTAEGALRAALLTGDPVKIAIAKKGMDDAADGVIAYDGSVNAHPESA